MKHRSFILIAFAAVPVLATAQVTPPTPPVVVQPAPVIAPAPTTPAAPTVIALPPGVRYIDRMDLDESLRRKLDDARWEIDRSVRSIDMQRVAEDARRVSEDALRNIDFARIAEDARIVSREAVRNLDVHRIAEDARISAHEAVRGIDVAAIAQNAKWAAQDAIRAVPMDFNFDFNQNAPRSSGQAFSLTVPRQWIQGDPADSIYQLAREAFSRQDYSRAATRFAEVLSKYPNYKRTQDAAYYEAFSRYRVGTLEQLRMALKVLEANAQKFQYSQQSELAPTLQANVLRALAQRNEGGAEAKLKDLYARYPATSCDRDQNSIKAQVLNSLYQADPDGSMPYIRDYLTMRDACSAELRKTAITLAANRPTDERIGWIVQIARQDTVREVRMRAIDVLSGIPNDAAITALQSLMTDPDDRVQSAAVRSLVRSDNPKAKSAIKTSIIDRRDAPEIQRISAIQSFDRDNTTPDDAAFLRNLFHRNGESDRIKESIISTLSRIPSEENVKFLLDIAKNPNESSTLRSRALSAVSRTTLQVDDLIKLYDANDSRSMRQTLVSALGSRREEAAVNKLLEIVKLSTDPEVRTSAMRTLMNKNDPVITKKLLDLIK